MPKYSIQTDQKFLVTYIVEADSKEQAFEILLDNSGDGVECEDQVPAEITGTFETSYVSEI